MIDINEIEKNTLNRLKDFQKATVERIDYLFKNGQKRILVADEVGLGKTLIARGTIVKAAKIALEQNKKIFKVVYVCSNQNIASQNIEKLNIMEQSELSSISQARLSMQHLIIKDQELKAKNNFLQLITLTPETSFKISKRVGSYRERALMFAILKRMKIFEENIEELGTLMEANAHEAWKRVKDEYEEILRKIEIEDDEYPKNIIQQMETKYKKTVENLKNHLQKMREHINSNSENNSIINQLRIMFAQISVEKLNPDLIIMDEFQRFKFLIDEKNKDTEIGILSQKFLKGDAQVLLLSATPYKLYSTIEEIEESKTDEHFKEFYQVMNFLFKDKKEEFEKVWNDYSVALQEAKNDKNSVICIDFIEKEKFKAEQELYSGVCRTERNSVMETGDYIDDNSVKNYLIAEKNDILSYVELQRVIKEIKIKNYLPIEYVKSCPYLLSFMNYQLKKDIETYFKKHNDQIKSLNKNIFWVERDKIKNYKELEKVNCRFEFLKEKVFSDENAANYLWMPPSKPYYKMEGVYRKAQNFSKTLVFSSWAIVPRMIGALISYEAERKTIGKICQRLGIKERKKAGYFTSNKKRYPLPRLRFNVSHGETKSLSLFTLLYPSEYLSNLYDPIDVLNRKLELKDVLKNIKDKLKKDLKLLEKKYMNKEKSRVDEKWYFLAPMLLDELKYVKDWINLLKSEEHDDNSEENITENKIRNKDSLKHIVQLENLLDDENLVLGKQPDDLLDVLANMVLGSPAVCIYRSNGNNSKRASLLSRIFISNFNLPESISVVDLSYGKSNDHYWKNVLKYCKDGCFQAMFDEYKHMLTETVGISNKDSTEEKVYNLMYKSLKMHTASYAVDTYEIFSKRVNNKDYEDVNLRASYAVAFIDEKSSDGKSDFRREHIRNAFNSPLRPFVLATTSIGQEGLDFHNYCRRVIHWNLPSNPIDLEQREGRINRYKCLAIRQNVAKNYGNIKFRQDVWQEMFDAAVKNEKKNNQSELVPFWCFGKNQDVKIERIVPMFAMSKDVAIYNRLVQILSLYRLTLGHGRQEELLDHLFKEFDINNHDDMENLRRLFIDLSPFSHRNK